MTKVTDDDILRTLELIRLSNKRKSYMSAPDYETFMPKQYIKTEPNSTVLNENIMDQIVQQGQDSLSIARIKAQNRADYATLQRARAGARQQRGFAQSSGRARTRAGNQARRNQGDTNVIITGGGGGGRAPNVTNVGGRGRWAAGRAAPFLPSRRGINPNAGMVTIRTAGGRVTVNRTAAGRFRGFINALSARGYRIHSLGGYANRNIAGTNTRSLHSYGLAIDINPGQNPNQAPLRTNMPPGVGALAARYGLLWGGNWNGPRFDTMHFSVPFFGRK